MKSQKGQHFFGKVASVGNFTTTSLELARTYMHRHIAVSVHVEQNLPTVVPQSRSLVKQVGGQPIRPPRFPRRRRGRHERRRRHRRSRRRHAKTGAGAAKAQSASTANKARRRGANDRLRRTRAWGPHRRRLRTFSHTARVAVRHRCATRLTPDGLSNRNEP
jgi:hypothetical protein